MIVSEGVREMPAAHPPEFRRRALDLDGQGNPVAQTARDLGISESCFATGCTATRLTPAANLA